MHGIHNTRHALRRLRGQIVFLTGLLCAAACAAMLHNLVNTSSVGAPGLVIAAAALGATALTVRGRFGTSHNPVLPAEQVTAPEL